jgi:hypothetical protein
MGQNKAQRPAAPLKRKFVSERKCGLKRRQDLKRRQIISQNIPQGAFGFFKGDLKMINELTGWDLKVFQEGRCPECKGTTFQRGPRGGMCLNIRCKKCGAEFNYTPSALNIPAQRIAPRLDERNPGLYHEEFELEPVPREEPSRCLCLQQVWMKPVAREEIYYLRGSRYAIEVLLDAEGQIAGRPRLAEQSDPDPVPEDEPVFILRARDLTAIGTLEAYLERVHDAGADTPHLEYVRQVIQEFRLFAERHAGRMKIPDTVVATEEELCGPDPRPIEPEDE